MGAASTIIFECMYGLDYERSGERAELRNFIWDVQITDLDFADDAVIFAETVEDLTEAL